jgi:hypothetical protein
LVPLLNRLGVKVGIGARLYPGAVCFGVEIHDAQRAPEGAAGRFRLDVGDECHKRRVPVEDHVKVAHLVTGHTIGALGIEPLAVIHILADWGDYDLQIEEIFCSPYNRRANR